MSRMAIWVRPMLGVVVLLVVTGAVLAGPQQIVRLRDGSTLRGEVLSLLDGVYTIKTRAMGTVKVALSDIVSINAADAEPGAVGDSAPVAPSVAPDAGPAGGSPGMPARVRGPKTLDGDNPRRSRPNAEPAGESTDEAAPRSPSVAHDPKRQQNQVNTKVQSMMMNQSFGSQVLGLQDNQDMLNVLDDPELMNAIQNLDYETLMKNEKMNQLMNNPEMRELLNSMQGGQ